MNRGQVPPQAMQVIGTLLSILVIMVILSAILASFESMSCKDEKAKITSLTGKLSSCQTNLNNEIAASQSIKNDLSACQNQLGVCQGNLTTCQDSYSYLENDCSSSVQIMNKLKDVVFVFQNFFIYQYEIYAFSLAIGSLFTLRLFKIEFRLYDKEEVKEFVKYFTRQHPLLAFFLFAIVLTFLFFVGRLLIFLIDLIL